MIMQKQSDAGLKLVLDAIAKTKKENPLSVKDKAVAYLRAQGEDVQTIADMLGVEEEYIKKLQERPDFAKQVVYIQGSLRQDLPTRMRTASVLAYETKLEQMLSAPRAEIRERSATFFLEQEIGKPTQKIQTINMNFQGGAVDDLDAKIEATQGRIKQIEEERQKLLDGAKS